jgi:hypothetical protein
VLDVDRCNVVCVVLGPSASGFTNDTVVEQPTHTDKSRSNSSSSTIPDAYPESKDRILAALAVLMGEKSGDSIVTQCMCSRRGQSAKGEGTKSKVRTDVQWYGRPKRWQCSPGGAHRYIS